MTERLGIEPQNQAYDAADPKQVEKAELAAKLRIEKRKGISAQLLNTPDGREWLWELLKGTGIFQDLVVVPDPYANGISIGKRQIGESLIRHLTKSSPENFGLLIRENDKSDG